MKKVILTLALLAITSPALATTGWVGGVTITRTLIRDGVFGNCMVYLNTAIANAGLNCPSKWVSFSCDGTYQSRDAASRMMDSAMMAFALDKRVSMQIDDLKKHNGYCVAIRIDVLK